MLLQTGLSQEHSVTHGVGLDTGESDPEWMGKFNLTQMVGKASLGLVCDPVPETHSNHMCHTPIQSQYTFSFVCIIHILFVVHTYAFSFLRIHAHSLPCAYVHILLHGCMHLCNSSCSQH